MASDEIFYRLSAPQLGARWQRRALRCNAIDVDEVFAHNHARNPNPLFDLINGYTVKIELPAAAQIAA